MASVIWALFLLPPCCCCCSCRELVTQLEASKAEAAAGAGEAEGGAVAELRSELRGISAALSQ